MRESYLDRLLELGGITREEAEHMSDPAAPAARKRTVRGQERFLRAARATSPAFGRFTLAAANARRPKSKPDEAAEQLVDLLEKQAHVPADFHPHPKIQRLLDLRHEMALGTKPLDWAAGEALALASLSVQGLRIRFSGQDSQRGTFSHRHAVLHDVYDGHTYMPLRHLAADQAPVEIYNSPLSEAGVLGFEYGYSLDCPDGLVMWEAQFGDFCNAAQVVIDQFIVSAEDKWNRLSGIVLLLPHGFEGNGPEHSSARLERFLSLAAKDNIQVVNPTTPAQLFHCLRRQVLRVWRKPLIVMTPKSLLRHPKVVSTLDECADGKFSARDSRRARRRANEDRAGVCSARAKSIMNWSRSGPS